ncbi:MAG: hypothetical protein JWN43_608 [Gammaproteobacteria bacterium]|nr:hypothetical protein [Gammaproteobacteria bacterium]
MPATKSVLPFNRTSGKRKITEILAMAASGRLAPVTSARQDVAIDPKRDVA